ncbi:MAG: hypothetical protein INH41_22850 [Myxococcaceae bacterium]|nr:hypothetical protein [Myxococcaceae bacterium]MCA3015238.1 hypothetical protein [Myxococcaceae bacterium]
MPRAAFDSAPRTSHQNLPKVPAEAPPAAPTLGGAVGLQELQTNPFQKALRASGFDENEREKLEVVLGRGRPLALDADEEDSGSHEFFDGETPASRVTTRSTWRALAAPVRSRPRKRSPRTLWTVIDQFAVAHNKRYDVPPGAAESRAHVFAWDVSLAMECPIPHHRMGRELTLAQTLDWLRNEAPSAGWFKVDAGTAVAAADAGQLVYALPKNPKLRQLAVVRPGGAGDDGLPRVASAGQPRGNDLGVVEAVGKDALYLTHP